MALVEVLTVPVVTAKLALVEPAATVTLDGTCAALLLLESKTLTLLVGAELRDTVPVDEVPLVTVVGLRVSEETVTEDVAGLTVRLALAFDPL